ncbi:hypothetical protein DET61_11833 [Marinobacter nauticus]|uniref:Uncharacterized protein n=1 Tax=Marinobacter nauticus TaxID=2743 RepID=A0A368X635_MARNT|nr:hypothetical protein [Marinobacter nauticus]RCW63481.1 hypothetical protein DET61_11833 [Marinobacter nauticus]
MTNTQSLKAVWLAGAIALGAGLVGGCMPGTIATGVGTGFVYEQKQDHKHRHEVERAVDQYVEDHANSPCRHGEDRVMESAAEILKEYRLTGLKEVLGRLDKIYQDESQPDHIRAGALYNMAVLQSRRKEPNKVLAREYFKRLYVEFPNEYRCIFEESDWRDSMIEQQLLLPGETVESFLRDAKADVERMKRQD